MYIENIKSPTDLKKLDIQQCNDYAQEIRNAILYRTSKIGGHLASNLGIVELTIALHYVFDSPKDKIIFDVSHQCYPHKIITGRAEAFIKEEYFENINGYTNPSESEHDHFRIGHTATSISLASGLAKGRDILKEDGNIIAIIGDGSLSGGQALEGLDFVASDINGNLIIIVNDNDMSIAENHGGIYQNLSDLRNTKGTCKNNIFTALGYEYFFVQDGHNITELVKQFKIIKDIKHPVVVHVCTIKGKGYKYAEENKELYHWTRPFELINGEEKNPFSGERYDRIIRDYLIDRMKKNTKIVTLIAAVPDALSFTKEYREQVKNQFIDVGIAEEHAIAMAGGLARKGVKPIFATMSTFYQRTYDQIFQELCINNLAVTMIVVNASVYATNDVTHVGVFDIPLISNIPNIVYLAPTNKQEYLAMIDWSIEQNKHPVAVRAPRNGVFCAKYEVDTDYSNLNKYKIIKSGNRVAIIALGDFYQMGEEVCNYLEESKGIVATLINPRFITGLDEELLIRLIDNHSIIVTLEDGILDGGFGQKIASFYGDRCNIVVLNYGLKKEFLDRYCVTEILKKNRLDPKLIVEDIEKFILEENENVKYS